MRIVLSIIALMTGVLAALNVGYMFYGFFTGAFSNGAGMAILFFQLWGVIFASLAVGFGVLSRFLFRRAALLIPWTANAGLGLGVLSGLMLLSIPFWT